MIKIGIAFIVLMMFNIIYSDDFTTSIFAQGEHQVIIVRGAYDITQTEFFEPSQILIKPNNTIKWINNDTKVVHTVTSIITFGKSDVFDSGNLYPGDDFKYTFYRPGIFDYYCKVHPFSVGKVIVR